jgi:hypothetical protein
MDKIAHYQFCLQTLVEKYGKYQNRNNDIETQILIDINRHHYQLMRVGWQELKRTYYTILHFDIRDSKVWIQCNNTDIDIAEELVNMGIPREDIVLGLHPPYKRPLTGYGVA